MLSAFAITISMVGKRKAPLYHYTDKKGLVGIIKSKHIKASTNTTSDCMMGKGTYFTKKPPTCSTTDLERNNYGGSVNKKKNVEFYVKFAPSKVGTTKQTRNPRKVSVKPGTRGISLNRATAIGQRHADGRVTEMKLQELRNISSASRRRR